MSLYGPGIVVLLIQFAFAAHVIRSGRSYIWILPIMFLPLIGCIAYLIFAVVPDMARSDTARRFADDVVNTVDPGRGYREKKRQVELVGSGQAKRELADECIKRGYFQDAIDLYQSAMQGGFENDPAFLHGLARARLLAGDGAGAQAAYERLKAADPVAFNADAELDYARALALQGRNEEALQQYEKVLPKYPGEEARCRYGLFLQKIGQTERAQRVFREIVESMRGAPSYYRSRQREWVKIARQNLS
ncbi:MAG: PLDc N-terminal domain-containing protein [Alphaproteobacteria bacterium]|nr:PLDc N-terminal domain-containing protein [Alphaproteobacteria bacterium]